MTQYARGRRFEYRVKQDLEKRGYYAVLSPGSHSVTDIIGIRYTGYTDLLTVHTHRLLFVQCKFNGTLGPQDWNELMDVAAKHGGIPILSDTVGPRKPLRYWQLTERKLDRKHIQRKIEFTP